MKILAPAADEADVSQPAAGGPGGRGVDRFVLPVDPDEARIGTVGGDVAQQFPVGATDLAEDASVEPVAEPTREPVRPRNTEGARRGDQVGELGQPVGIPAVAGRGGAVAFRFDRRSVPRRSAGSTAVDARARIVPVGIGRPNGGRTASATADVRCAATRRGRGRRSIDSHRLVKRSVAGPGPEARTRAVRRRPQRRQVEWAMRQNAPKCATCATSKIGACPTQAFFHPALRQRARVGPTSRSNRPERPS